MPAADLPDDSAHAGNGAYAVKDTEAQGYDGDVAKVAGGQVQVISKKSAHSIGLDSPYEVGFHLIAALGNAFILSYPFLIMSFLGWPAGATLMVVIGILSLYCNRCLAQLHEFGGKRNIRFRDLTSAVLGRWVYYPTWVLQWINLLAANVGLVILAGESIKAVHDTYNDNQNIKLTEWIAITGFCCGLFAVLIPHYHNLRIWSTISVGLVIVFASIAIGISIHDGATLPARDYGVHGSPAGKAFDAMGALGTIAFVYNTVILPEIQASVRPPSTQNMYKALWVDYGVGLPLYCGISFIGWWAYGSYLSPGGGITPNLLLNNSFSGPTWAVTVANIAAFLQIIVSLHIYATPVYEAIETRFSRLDESAWSLYNFLQRLVGRGFYIACTAFVAMLLPFFGDFVAFTGSISALPLDFVLVLAMHVVVNKGMNPVLKGIHWALVGLLCIVTLVSTVSSIRYIVVDATNYHVFANISG